VSETYYESDDALAQYLWLHYVGTGDQAPFPVRCVTHTLDRARLPARARALDLGCAVGRSTFELARWCDEVVGLDYSQRFVAAARQLQAGNSLSFDLVEQGDLKERFTARAPEGVARDRVRFETGDAQALPDTLGSFDVVLMANLLCRLNEPRRLLARAADLVKPGGQLVITTPSTWKDIHTPRENWLGGFTREGVAVRTLDGLQNILAPRFTLTRRSDLTLLIREHARKFEYIVSEATVWLRV
jgi:putative 4-mercaptohistidine N1-methyltranferase